MGKVYEPVLRAFERRWLRINDERKIKVYLDTSVISYLDQQDAPEKMNETREVWERIKTGQYEIFISDVVLRELNDCKDEVKRDVLFSHLSEIKYHLITVDESTVALAEKTIDNGVLKKKNLDDCQHISAAILSNCDIIISWNFNHIVNVKTIRGIKVITTVEGYKDLLIYPPSALLSEEEWQMDEIKKPDVSPRFDVDDIRKIRDYNSQRHSKMTRKEIVEDIRKGAEEVIKKYGLNVTYAQKLN